MFPGTRRFTSSLALIALAFCILQVGQAQAQQQRDLLALDPIKPIDRLSRGDLEAVGAERLLCRSMLTAVNDLVALLEGSATPDQPFNDAFARARNSWPGSRGRCDAAIGELGEGWPRSVLRQEFERVLKLWAALVRVAVTYESGGTSKELEAAVNDYQTALDTWREWLERSLDFWAGAWLVDRPEATCANTAETRVTALAKKLWLLATRPADQRSAEATSDISIRIEAEREAVSRCSGGTPLDEVLLGVLTRRLSAYEEGLAGLHADDDLRIRSAMESEQRLAARATRCRQEHDRGNPSPDCLP